MNEVRDKMRRMQAGEQAGFLVPDFEAAFPGILAGAPSVEGTDIHTGHVIENGTRDYVFYRQGDHVSVSLDTTWRPATP
jgi:hypothetical protein